MNNMLLVKMLLCGFVFSGVACAGLNGQKIPTRTIATSMSYTIPQCGRGTSEIKRINAYSVEWACAVGGGQPSVYTRYTCTDQRMFLDIETYPECDGYGDKCETIIEVWCHPQFKKIE
jgi:hypothetical protein